MKVSITSHRREERAVRGLVSHPDINNPVLYFSDFFFCICILSTLTGFMGCKDGRTARIEQASYLRSTAKREEVAPPRSRHLKLQVKKNSPRQPPRGGITISQCVGSHLLPGVGMGGLEWVGLEWTQPEMGNGSWDGLEWTLGSCEGLGWVGAPAPTTKNKE